MQPTILWAPTFHSGGTAVGCEVDYSLPPSTEVTNEWSYTSTPLYAFMALTGQLYLFTSAAVWNMTTYGLVNNVQMVQLLALRGSFNLGNRRITFLRDHVGTLHTYLLTYLLTYSMEQSPS
jgi:hypothetical protein